MDTKKDIHIVFKVFNFVNGPESDPYNLTITDRYVLLTLARFKGPKGIYPSIPTLARELKTSSRQLYRIISHLESLKLLKIDKKIGRSSSYSFPFLDDNLSTDHGHPCQGLNNHTPDTHVRGPLTPMSQTPDTHVTQSININLKDQRGAKNAPTSSFSESSNQNQIAPVPCTPVHRSARKKSNGSSRRPEPLPDDFYPDDETIALSESLGFSPEKLPVFQDYCKARRLMSYDWQATFRKFLRDEYDFGQRKKQNGNGYAAPRAANEIRSTVPDYVPGQQFQEIRDKPCNPDVAHQSLADIFKKLGMRSRH